jgi:hypothetical protein
MSIFLLPIIALYSPIKVDKNVRNLILLLFSVFLILLIGFRHEVGGDWFHYIRQYSILEDRLLLNRDPGYSLVHWFSLNYLNGIYSTNLISASILIYGLIRFCAILPLPWLAITVSIPYIIVIIGMGYTRQSVALGFILMALLNLMSGKSNRFYFFVILASLFHQTALVFSAIGFLVDLKKRQFSFSKAIILFTIILFSFVFLLMDRMSDFIYHYIENQSFQSHGALLRIAMSIAVAAIYFIYRKKYKRIYNDDHIWFYLSLGIVCIFILSFFASTAADRLAIYFLPLQLVVLSRFPTLIETTLNRTFVVSIIVIVYAASLLVWLNFGIHSKYWLPYKNLLVLM